MSLGQKIYRKAQVLGNKISTQSRMLGEKIKEVQPYTNVLEKGNYRKTFDDAVKNNLSQNSFI